MGGPAGHSEHHTGCAIDIGDGSQEKCDVEICFERTGAYRWLVKNAVLFGFELSFSQEQEAVSFEPWHWRFVGGGGKKKGGIFRVDAVLFCLSFPA